MKAVITNRILLSRTEELVGSLRENLTRYFPNKNYKKPPVPECDLGFVMDNILTVPVARTDLIPSNYEVVDKRVTIPVKFPEFKATLRDSQQKIYDDVDDNCVINAKPGFGKTFTALAIVGKLGQKTLVITHTLNIRRQWENEIKNVFGITPGVIGSGEFNINKDIVVSNIQTLNKRVDELVTQFGLVIIDECHHVPANTFKKTIDKMKARYKIGLSGTLKRKDGRHVLLDDYIGGKIYVPPKENTVDPIVIIRQTDIQIPGTYRIPWANRMNQVYSNPRYIEEITGLAVTQAERGHIVVVLASRIEFLERCHSLTKDISVVITSKSDNRAELEKEVISGEKPILWGSLTIYSEGVSINEFSSLIIATALTNESLLEQIAGRINRINEGGLHPELMDVAFAGNTGRKQLKTRENFYRQEGWKIIYV